MAVEPFTIKVSDGELDDLKERLARTRWPDQLPGTTWEYGTDITYLKELVAYWRDGYDWRKHERTLNRFPQFKTQVDGVDLHFVHEKGKGPNPLPLLISHGWPGSFYEMYKAIGPLTDPAAHGGDPADAFDVVVPSLPGYGFSGPTRERGVNVVRIAALLHGLMTKELGYDRFGAQGGDWGAGITTNLGHAYPDSLVGVHVNMIWFFIPPEGELTEDEKKIAERATQFRNEETGYQQIQGTKPQTLAYGLNDSPAGLAAWIVEKWRTWSDCDGDVEKRFSKDELLTNVMIYWLTGTINSSTRLYYEFRHAPWMPTPDNPVRVPTGIAAFPKEIIPGARRNAERGYNIVHWTDMPSGGHFAAMEEPELLVEDIRSFFRKLR
jgi:pimeloyl-ACP methyl ester carboxylesterase